MTWGETLITAAQAGELAGRQPATIRSWVLRGWLAPAGNHGRTRLYRTRDVLQAERDTRARDSRDMPVRGN